MTPSLDEKRRLAIREKALEAMLELPEQIDRYEIRGELGRGGMGIVYDAIDPELDRPVAIKVMRSDQTDRRASDSLAARRFEREMRTVSPIFHPNVVTILDAGSVTLGDRLVRFYVMESVAGESLEDRIRRVGALDSTEVAAIARDVAEGLAALHDRGIVHRDVKPSNVLLPTDGPAKVSDFGLVHLIADLASDEEAGIIAGSTHGLAPEQLHEGRVDERTDLFALGGLILRMFTGDEPFAASSLGACFERIQFDTPTGLESVPRRWRDFVSALLEKSPQKRPSGARAVVQEIDRLSGSPIRSRRRALLHAAISVSIASLLAIGWNESQQTRINQEREAETIRHHAALASLLERSEILSPLATAQLTQSSLPADERRAATDRLEGIANRIAYEKGRHAEEIARIETNRVFFPSLLIRNPGRRDSMTVPRSSQPQTAKDAIRKSSKISEEAVIDTELELFHSEFGVDFSIETKALDSISANSRLFEANAATGELLAIRLVLDPTTGRGQIETSRALEGALPDGFVGALLREQILPLIEEGNTTVGVRLVLRILRDHFRHDPHAVEILQAHEPSGAQWLFAGGGAAAAHDSNVALLDNRIDSKIRSRFEAAPTVDSALERFLAWLELETADTDVGIFDSDSRAILASWPASRPYWRYLVRESVRQEKVRSVERGDVALLYSLADLELAPLFFRRSERGWQIDLSSNEAHLLEIAGGDKRWTFRNVSEEPLSRFQDILRVEEGLIRWASNKLILP